jgi:hypothetical protein
MSGARNSVRPSSSLPAHGIQIISRNWLKAARPMAKKSVPNPMTIRGGYPPEPNSLMATILLPK